MIAAGLLTDVIELAVGVACLAAVPATWRRMRWLGITLLVAGMAATVHAVVSMAT